MASLLLRKIGRRGGLFGILFSRPIYETTINVETAAAVTRRSSGFWNLTTSNPLT